MCFTLKQSFLWIFLLNVGNVFVWSFMCKELCMVLPTIVWPLKWLRNMKVYFFDEGCPYKCLICVIWKLLVIHLKELIFERSMKRVYFSMIFVFANSFMNKIHIVAAYVLASFKIKPFVKIVICHEVALCFWNKK